MGAIWILIFTNKTPEPITNTFVKQFLTTSNRGSHHSEIVSKSTINIHKNDTIKTQAKNELSLHNFKVYKRYHFIQGFHRMAINDLTFNAIQPFESSNCTLMCNGEIYNYQTLMSNHNITNLTSDSDIEFIIPLYKSIGITQVLELLNGEYSFVLTENLETFDLNTIQVFAATDFLSTKPLYLLYNTSINLYMVVTEIKNIPKYILDNSNYTITQIPPGSYWNFQSFVIQNNEITFTEYFDYNSYLNLNNLTWNSRDPTTLTSLYNTIRTEITTSTLTKFDFGTQNYSSFLLTGHFDTSILLSIIVENLYQTNQMNILDHFTVFTVSDCDQSSDVICSKICINYLNDKYSINLNHQIVYVSDTILIKNALENIIYIIESYDVNVIINGVFLYFLYTYINTLNINIKSIITGNGLDEYCGYSQLFEYNNIDFQTKSMQLLKNMYKEDILQVDKLSGYFGLESRYPYLDKNVFNLIMNIHPSLKQKVTYNINELPIDKYIIRKAFDTGNYLPETILWRHRSCITDCPTNIKQNLIEYFNTIYTTDELNTYSSNITHYPPSTTLDMHLRKTFVNLFSDRCDLIDERHSIFN